jgi:hypothetical protein
MKRSALVFFCLLTLLLFCEIGGNARAADSSDSKVSYTRLPEDVKGLTKLGVVHGKASKVFGSQDKLREKAIAKAQAEAAALGATVILITVDNFEATPINNVTIEAVAYGPAKDAVSKDPPATTPKKEKVEEREDSGAVASISPEKVEVTRLSDDVKDRTKLGVVHGKASKVFGSQDKLRARAILEAQTEAAKLGATTILITVDKFEPTPINNVAIEAVAYK